MSNEQQSLQTLFQNLAERKHSWRWVYLNARRAEGIESITQAVQAAENAMFLRWQELSGQKGDVQERAQLEKANDELLKIKIEKLGWPRPVV
jgi:hypothetical protein